MKRCDMFGKRRIVRRLSFSSGSEGLPKGTANLTARRHPRATEETRKRRVKGSRRSERAGCKVRAILGAYSLLSEVDCAQTRVPRQARASLQCSRLTGLECLTT